MKRVIVGLLVISTTVLAGTAREKQLLEKQLSSVADARAAFAKDAVVVAPERTTTGAMLDPVQDGWLDTNDVTLGNATVGRITVGERGGVVWLAAEASQRYSRLDCPPRLARCNAKRTLRISELVADGKVVVAHVDDPVHDPVQLVNEEPMPAASKPGPLSAMLADPTALAAALLDDRNVIVLGTERKERAVGTAAARKLLRSWSKLSLTLIGTPHEVRTKTWGYAAVDVAWKAKSRTIHMRATVFAVDTSSGWKVVAVHYSLPYDRSD